MSGLDPNNAFAMVITPRFWLSRAAIATTLLCPNIPLEIDETLRENKHVALLEYFLDETIFRVGGDESNMQGAFKDNQDFSSTWIGVGCIDTIGA